MTRDDDPEQAAREAGAHVVDTSRVKALRAETTRDDVREAAALLRTQAATITSLRAGLDNRKQLLDGYRADHTKLSCQLAERTAEVEALRAERDESAKDRDDLLRALGWKLGALAESRDVVLNDTQLLRPEMAKARRLAQEGQAARDSEYIGRLEAEGSRLYWKRRAKAAQRKLAERDRTIGEYRGLLQSAYDLFTPECQAEMRVLIQIKAALSDPGEAESEE